MRVKKRELMYTFTVMLATSSGLLDNFGSSVLIVGELCNRLIFSSLFEDLGSFMISKLEPLKTVFVSSL